MKTLGEELRELQVAASMSFTEMAIWCDCHPSTMRLWIKGVPPRWVKVVHLRLRIKQLRWVLASSKRFPIPSEVTQFKRQQYVRQVKDVTLKQFSTRHPAGRRAKMLDEHP